MSKKVAIIIAFNGFKDIEYQGARKGLEKAGIGVEVFSNKEGIAVGAGGTRVETKDMREIKSEDFDGVVFIGGPGALENLDNDTSYRLAQEFFSKNKVVSAICISPTILAKSGILKGKRACVWYSPSYRESIRVLQENGAEWVDRSVVVDGKIITANGPESAFEFGEEVARVLSEQ